MFNYNYKNTFELIYADGSSAVYNNIVLPQMAKCYASNLPLGSYIALGSGQGIPSVTATTLINKKYVLPAEITAYNLNVNNGVLYVERSCDVPEGFNITEMALTNNADGSKILNHCFVTNASGGFEKPNMFNIPQKVVCRVYLNLIEGGDNCFKLVASDDNGLVKAMLGIQSMHYNSWFRGLPLSGICNNRELSFSDEWISNLLTRSVSTANNSYSFYGSVPFGQVANCGQISLFLSDKRVLDIDFNGVSARRYVSLTIPRNQRFSFIDAKLFDGMTAYSDVDWGERDNIAMHIRPRLHAATFSDVFNGEPEKAKCVYSGGYNNRAFIFKTANEYSLYYGFNSFVKLNSDFLNQYGNSVSFINILYDDIIVVGLKQAPYIAVYKISAGGHTQLSVNAENLDFATLKQIETSYNSRHFYAICKLGSGKEQFITGKWQLDPNNVFSFVTGNLSYTSNGFKICISKTTGKLLLFNWQTNEFKIILGDQFCNANSAITQVFMNAHSCVFNGNYLIVTTDNVKVLDVWNTLTGEKLQTDFPLQYSANIWVSPCGNYFCSNYSASGFQYYYFKNYDTPEIVLIDKPIIDNEPIKSFWINGHLSFVCANGTVATSFFEPEEIVVENLNPQEGSAIAIDFYKRGFTYANNKNVKLTSKALGGAI